MNQSQHEGPTYTVRAIDCFRNKAEVVINLVPGGAMIGMRVTVEGSGDARVVSYPRGVWCPTWTPANKEFDAEILKAIDTYHREAQAD